MAKVEMNFIVKGGEVKPAPPVGPALGQEGLPVGRVVADINKATKDWKGLKIPITVKADPVKKEWNIEVGTPLTSALLLQEADAEKGAEEAGNETIGDLSFKQVKKIAKLKEEELHTSNVKNSIKTVLGTMKSMGLTLEGKDPQEVLQNIDDYFKK